MPPRDGVQWLLAHQNEDGGWPACPGWDKLPYDRSAVELTAAALRALASCSASDSSLIADRAGNGGGRKILIGRSKPMEAGYPQGRNQHLPGEASGVIGTASVLLALADLGLWETDSRAAFAGCRCPAA
jgi:hypothetical protein